MDTMLVAVGLVIISCVALFGIVWFAAKVTEKIVMKLINDTDEDD